MQGINPAFFVSFILLFFHKKEYKRVVFGLSFYLRWLKAIKKIADIAREGKKALLNEDWDELAYLMNKNHEIQNSLADSGEQNLYMIKVARENGALSVKLAGAGGGGTIIALTLEPERTMKVLKEAGAETFVEFAPDPEGVKVEEEKALKSEIV
ncbi:MAG TPA: hypothetical protein VIK77_05670 [Tissierellaceae bacterium]